MELKAAFFICVPFVFVCISEVVGAKGDLTAGSTFGKQHIHHEVFHRKGAPFVKRVVEAEVRAPVNRTIQAVVVKDLEGNGESYIQRGGVGLPAVTLKLKSPRARGLRFMVDVYA